MPHILGKYTGAMGPPDHGALTGLGDDDHLQYLTSARTETQLTGSVHTVFSAGTLYGKLRNIYTENITASRTVGVIGFSSDTRLNNTAAFQADTASGCGHTDFFAYTAGTNSIWMGEQCSFNSQIKLTNSAGLVVQPAIHAYKSTIDAGGVTISTSPISFSFTNPSTAQNWAAGYMSVDAYGNGASEQIACYTTMRANGAGSGIGYKGYATPSSSAHTGPIIGVAGYAVLAYSANNLYAAAFEANTLNLNNTQTPVSRRMGLKSNAHILVNAASLIVATGTSVSPDALSAQTGHLNFSGAGDLYVQGNSEFDNEVFFDHNVSNSIVSITGTYTASSKTIILANGTFSIYLPAAAGCVGRRYIVKNTGSGTITVDGNGIETIDTGTTASVAALAALRIVSDGTGWWML